MLHTNSNYLHVLGMPFELIKLMGVTIMRVVHNMAEYNKSIIKKGTVDTPIIAWVYSYDHLIEILLVTYYI